MPHQQYAEMHTLSFTTVKVFAIEIINIFYFSLSCTKTVKESDDVFSVEVDIKLCEKNLKICSIYLPQLFVN